MTDSFNIATGIGQFFPDIIKEAHAGMFKYRAEVCTVVGEIIIKVNTNTNHISTAAYDSFENLYQDLVDSADVGCKYVFGKQSSIGGSEIILQMKEGTYEYCNTVLECFYKSFSGVIAYIKGKLPDGLVMDSAVVKYNVNIQNKFEFKIPEVLKYNAEIHYVG